MKPYHQIFPDAREPVMTLSLSRKSATIPKGTYGFIECYCTIPWCDCRRVAVVVLNDKLKQKCVINFGFDQEGPMAGPYLDHSNTHAPYASELLEFFVNTLNTDPEWLGRMYRQYRAVREKVTGKRYRGKLFPAPGKLVYRVMPPPDLEDQIRMSLKESTYCPSRLPSDSKPRRRRSAATDSETKTQFPHPLSPQKAEGMAALVQRYVKAGIIGHIDDLLALQDDLRRYMLAREDAADELASLLPVLCRQSPEDDEQIDAALRLLSDMLEFLQIELEDRRSGAEQRMARLQNALAQRIYLENEDADLCASVSNLLLQSRVEILPVLREANTRMMKAGAARLDLQDLPGEEIMAGITRSLEAMGVSSPFEGVQAMLELFRLNEPEIQIALTGEMLRAENPTLREMSALMLFHSDAEVRLGVSRLLAELEGRRLTPDTLRRLIVSRNWFPEQIRKNIDLAIGNARKARVECAPLAARPAMTVYVSPEEPSGARSFQVVVPQDKWHSCCSILFSPGVGVTEAFVLSFKSRREFKSYLESLQEESYSPEPSADHLDQSVCRALADGIRHGTAPSYWLVRIAELLGSDRWNPAPFGGDAEDQTPQDAALQESKHNERTSLSFEAYRARKNGDQPKPGDVE